MFILHLFNQRLFYKITSKSSVYKYLSIQVVASIKTFCSDILYTMPRTVRLWTGTWEKGDVRKILFLFVCFKTCQVKPLKNCDGKTCGTLLNSQENISVRIKGLGYHTDTSNSKYTIFIIVLMQVLQASWYKDMLFYDILIVKSYPKYIFLAWGDVNVELYF